jgi:uncharacterized protein (TIGR02145 family)
MVADDECNCYTTSDFGAAGVWMTQNLRTRAKSYDGLPNLAVLTSASLSAEIPRCTYPRPVGSTDFAGAFNANPEYGMLYNWVAASGRVTTASEYNQSGQTRYQGICPNGWHLPSDYEWYVLEYVISESAANVYSTAGPCGQSTTLFANNSVMRGTHGSKMKTTTVIRDTIPGGTSLKREEGGFDVLLVGCNGGVPLRHGGAAYFWSSSSNNQTYAYARTLLYDNTGVGRFNNNDKRLYLSVRCKQD